MSEVISEVEQKRVKPVLDFLEVSETATPQDARALTGKSAATTSYNKTLS